MKLNRPQRSVKDSDKELVQKKNFYKSLKIGIESFQAFIGRFEKLANELSLQETGQHKEIRTGKDKPKLQEHCSIQAFRLL